MYFFFFTYFCIIDYVFLYYNLVFIMYSCIIYNVFLYYLLCISVLWFGDVQSGGGDYNSRQLLWLMTQLLRFSKQILSKPPYHHLISEYKIIYNIDDIYNKSFKTNPFKTSLSPSHCHPCLFYVEAKLDCLLFLLKNFCMGGSSISLYSSVSRAAQQD